MTKRFQLKQRTEEAGIKWHDAKRNMEICELVHRDVIGLYRQGFVDAGAIAQAAMDVQAAKDQEARAWREVLAAKDAWLAEVQRVGDLRKTRPRRAAIARRLWMLRAKRRADRRCASIDHARGVA
ncbi:hypothetical protein [Burkholderia diffusa]|uniref:hypothetical protein n=1 Tax=Burkholderia diffusa TaxID=488732 RepID=UPI00158F48C2|nr:hypothetical protein [Burkholderia diffusa]